MIELKVKDGEGAFKITGSHELLELEMSLLVKNLVNNVPELFINALVDNMEILEKELK